MCDDCGAPFSVVHSLDCCFGGLVTRRHNEVRDAFGDLASLVWSPNGDAFGDLASSLFSVFCLCGFCGVTLSLFQ